MEILYFGTMCSEQMENQILKITKSTGNVAQNNLERALMNELIKIKQYSISAYCIPCMPYEVLGKHRYMVSRKDMVFENFYTQTYSVMKIPIVKYMSYFFQTIKYIKKWMKNSRKDEKRIIYITVNFVPVSFAISFMKKIYKYKTVAMVSDLAKDQYADNRIKEFKFLRRCSIPFYNKVAQILEKNHDGFIFLSKAMNCINKDNKPYAVMEGIFNNNLTFKEYRHRENVILYAGALNEKYGIGKILEIMKKLTNIDVTLEIYGDGAYKSKILEQSKKDKRIVYKGFVTREELFDRMQKVKVLVNLRDPRMNYTKYSFPSKMFEYMASGTPVLTTRLEGIPEEYYEFVYSIDGYDTAKIANKLKEILEKDNMELTQLGSKAREFILNKKTSKNQVNQVIQIIENIG